MRLLNETQKSNDVITNYVTHRGCILALHFIHSFDLRSWPMKRLMVRLITTRLSLLGLLFTEHDVHQFTGEWALIWYI